MVAGFCVVVMRGGGEAELDGLFVEPAFWRRGLGARLTANAAEVAVARGADVLTVVAAAEGREFYERQGFVASGEVETRFGVAVEMRRPLDQARKGGGVHDDRWRG